MIAIHSVEPRLQDTVERLLIPLGPVRPAATWRLFRRTLTTSSVGVVVAPDLGTDGLVSRLTELHRKVPLRPVVVVTDSDPENLKRLGRVQVAGVVWLGELEAELSRTVELARSNVAEEFVRRLLAAGPSAAHLGQALRRLFGTVPPFRTVDEWARAAGPSSTTLRRWWSQAYGGSPPLRLQDLVRWILLIRAVEARGQGRSRRAVLSKLACTETRLTRACRDLLGKPLKDVEGLGGRAVVDKLVLRLENAR